MNIELNPENFNIENNFTNYVKSMNDEMISIFEFQPDYSKCTDERQEVYHNICKHIRKHDIMICTLNNKPCIAWKGYKHE